MKHLIHHVKKHSKRIVRHLNTHKHKYLFGTFGTFGTFAIVKTFLLLVGFFGTLHIANIFAADIEVNSGNIVSEYGCATDANSCNLSNKGINSIAPDTFVNHTNLQYLYLNSNQISSIESGDFDGLTNLQQLYLDSNQISSIDSGVFAGLSNLQYLYLNNNQINSIESGDFDGLTNLTTLYLDSNQISSIEAGDFDGLTNLTTLGLDSNQISSIEAGDFDGLTNLTTLGLGGNQISSIEAGDFDGLTNLTTLNLYSNQISSIEAGDFDGLTNLTILNLYSNQISSIDSGVFAGLSNLQYLGLGGNQISSIDSGVFDGLTNLTTLGLDNNQISSIEAGDFAGLSNLQYLYLDYNQISSIEAGDFDGLSNLNYLYLNYNQISSIESGVFDGLTNLQQLYLGGNQISSIDSGVFAGLTNLQRLRLNTNLLTTLPEVATGLINLSTLSLDTNCRDVGLMSTDLLNFLDSKVGNSTWQSSLNPSCPVPVFNSCADIRDISEAECEALSGFYVATNGSSRSNDSGWLNSVYAANWYGVTVSNGHVSQINLQGNNLSGHLYLSGLSNLQYLYLYNNQISSIESGAFAGLTNLYYLELNYNKLSSIESGDFAGLSNLTTLHLGGNQISSIESGDFDGLTNLTTLYLNSNQISSIEAGDFAGLTNLTTLNLYSNQISSIEAGVFAGLTNLQQLYLGGNQISSIDSGVFAGLTNLTTLGLDSNLLTTLPESTTGLINGNPYGGWLLENNCWDIGSMSNELIAFLNNKSNGDGWQSSLNPLCNTEPYCGDNNTDPGEACDDGGANGTPGMCNATCDGYEPGDTEPYCGDNNTDPGEACDDGGANGTPGMCNTTCDGYDPIGELSGGNIVEYCPIDADSCYLSNKGITSIAADTFVNHNNLQQLNLGDNQISVLPEGIFDNLSNLQSLYLYGNQISVLPEGIFDSLTELRDLSLYDNQISVLPEGIFDSLTGLTYLELGGNQISVLPEGIFDSLTELRDLYLVDNQISVLPEGIFDNLTGLRNLRLNNNQISGSLDVLCDLTGLQYLRISYNHFSGPIPACFFDFEDLRRGMIDYNYLSLDGLTTAQQESLDNYFYSEGEMISDRRDQYFLNDMSVDQTITASGSDRWDISMAYTNGLSALDHAFVYYTMGDFNLQNSSASYTTGGVFKDYGISGDVCYDSFYYNNTGGYRNAINDRFVQGQEINIEDLILEELDYQSGTSDRGTTYIGDGSDMGKYFIDWIQYGDEFSFQGNVLIELMDKVLGLDYTAITGCGTLGIPAYIFDLGALGSGATGTITFRITSQDVIAPTAYIHSSDRLRVDPSTGNNSMILSLSGQGSSIETGNVTTGENNDNPTSSPSQGGGGGITKDICANMDCSTSYYDKACGICPSKPNKDKVHQAPSKIGDITNSPYSTELNSAYLRAYNFGITTMPTIQQANIEGNLIRSHMAKMMVEFAALFDRKINTGANCSFTDMRKQSDEMKYYSTLACQLGLMGLDDNGTPAEKFNPSDTVTRAQFGTVLSRLLYGNVNNAQKGTQRYAQHLEALKNAGIMKKIDDPSMKELRGYVMLMMMRAGK